MKANEIRAELLRRNITVKSVAEALGIKHPSVSQVIYGVKRTQYIREYIASKVNKPVSDLWPEQEQA
ncbi:helix-turn-helix domain-containing protein [Desulfobulbus sp.]|uniref:helix-turn-helix domain-containing protein n=1 Tax=Desulfobulbus sp. TaxID=895 RepID=UPI0027BA05D9|nr:helix-turn-helix domain-containing protein [Desulfobulbus sp.]